MNKTLSGVVGCKPKSHIVADKIRSRIRSGELSPGERLPSVRSLADEFKVGRQVVLSAFGILEKESLVTGEVGRGTFVNGLAGLERESGMLRITYLIVRGALDAKFDDLISSGLRRACERAGHKFTVCENVVEKDLATISKNSDITVISGRVTNTFLAKKQKLGGAFVSIGNRALFPGANNIRFGIASLIRKILEADTTHKKSVGIITGSVHFPSTHEQIAVLEEYASEYNLRWDRACVVCVDSFYGASEIESAWGMERNWPARVIMTLHTYLGFAQFAAENLVRESEYPEITVIGADPRFMPLPYPKFHALAVDTHEFTFGEQLLPLLERIVSGAEETPFSAVFDPGTCEIYMEKQQ